MNSLDLDLDPILTVNDVARVTKRSTDSVYLAIQNGYLKARRMGERKWMLARKDVEDWINAGCPNGKSPRAHRPPLSVPDAQ